MTQASRRKQHPKKVAHPRKRAPIVAGTISAAEPAEPGQTPAALQTTPEERVRFWETLLRAVDTEPVPDVKTLRGGTGLDHPLIAMGIDRVRSRVVIISAEPDGRFARLTQADIQANLEDYHVITARPIAVNLAKTAGILAEFFGKTQLGQSDLDRLSRLGKNTRRLAERRVRYALETGVLPSIQALGYATLRVSPSIQDVLTQLSHVQFIATSEADLSSGDKELRKSGGLINLGPLVGLDPAELDRQMGICSVPLYQLSPDEAAVFHSGSDIEAAKHILKAHDIYQYFYPAPDTLAISLVDAKKPLTPEALMNLVKKSAVMGHPLGAPELLTGDFSIDELADALQQHGYTMEGELGLELTERGQEKRLSVKFKPREGLLSLILQRFSVNIDISLKDFLGPPGPKT